MTFFVPYVAIVSQLEPRERIEPSTSVLPRLRSATELPRRLSQGARGGIRTPEALRRLVYSEVRLTTSLP